MTDPFALDTPPAPSQPTPPPAQPSTPAASYGDDPFGAPAPQLPKGPRLRDIYGRLLLLVPQKLERNLPNKLRPGETQDRMTAHVVILDGGPIAFGGAPEKTPPKPHTMTAQVPHRNESMFISSVGLISQCREALQNKANGGGGNVMVLGRLSAGEQKDPTQSAPYILTPATDADKQIARAYLAANPPADPFA